LTRIVERLDRRRFDPVAVLPSPGPLVEKLAQQGCRVIIAEDMLKLTSRRGRAYILRYAGNYPRAVWRLARTIRQERIDLVHTNTLHNLYGFLAAKLTGRPHVWHVREIVVQSDVVRPVELFLARRFSDRVIVTSQAVGEMFSNGNGVLPPNLVKIPNSINVEEFHPRNCGAQLVHDLGLAPDTPLVGLVCRLDHWKGVDTFLQAAAICRKQFPQCHYVIVGGAIEGREEYAAAMERLAHELELGDVVHFTAWRYQPKDMPQVHAALSILVLASSWPEPFGLVLLEAMATGKPVVATNHGGPAEICVNGETAILVPPRDPPSMAEAILTLLRDPGKAQAMGVAGRRRVEALYDQTKCIRRLEAVYDELLA
jgi:glycosyltransferase involved in cell wall biosynthesis